MSEEIKTDETTDSKEKKQEDGVPPVSKEVGSALRAKWDIGYTSLAVAITLSVGAWLAADRAADATVIAASAEEASARLAAGLQANEDYTRYRKELLNTVYVASNSSPKEYEEKYKTTWIDTGLDIDPDHIYVIQAHGLSMSEGFRVPGEKPVPYDYFGPEGGSPVQWGDSRRLTPMPGAPAMSLIGKLDSPGRANPGTSKSSELVFYIGQERILSFQNRGLAKETRRLYLTVNDPDVLTSQDEDSARKDNDGGYIVRIWSN